MSFDVQFAHWQQIRDGLMHTLDKFSEDELAYRPFPGARSVAEIILHIADAEDGWLRYVVTKELAEWPAQYTPEKYPDLPALKEVLATVHGRTDAYLAALSLSDLEMAVSAPWGATFSLGWIIWHVLEHEIHHRGELSLTLGLLGKEGLDV